MPSHSACICSGYCMSYIFKRCCYRNIPIIIPSSVSICSIADQCFGNCYLRIRPSRISFSNINTSFTITIISKSYCIRSMICFRRSSNITKGIVRPSKSSRIVISSNMYFKRVISIILIDSNFKR